MQVAVPLMLPAGQYCTEYKSYFIFISSPGRSDASVKAVVMELLLLRSTALALYCLLFKIRYYKV